MRMNWAFDMKCERYEAQYPVVWLLIIGEERNRRKSLSRTDQELVRTFFYKELGSRRIVSDRTKHWLDEYIFQGWWRSRNQAKMAVLDLVDKIAVAEPIEELRWVCLE